MMKCSFLPHIWSPQHEVVTKTSLGLHRGTGLRGFGKHSSVRVWLLHVHRLQLDTHTSPGWKRGTYIHLNLKSNLESEVVAFFYEENVPTSLGSPLGPLQSVKEKKISLISTSNIPKLKSSHYHSCRPFYSQAQSATHMCEWVPALNRFLGQKQPPVFISREVPGWGTLSSQTETATGKVKLLVTYKPTLD